MLRASVIVPARDAGRTLARTLDALSQQQIEGDYEVLVVDDGSTDDTAALAHRAPGPVTVLSQPARGPAAARNLGVQHARAPSLAFCDADVYPTPGWLNAGLETLERADIVQGHVLPEPGVALGPFDRTIWITSAVGLWETANLFVTRAAFDRAGGFQEWLTPRHGKALAEDVWFGYRVLRGGGRSAFSADALAHHAVFPRGWREYSAERTRLRYFPAMAAKMPELRSAFLYRRVFLNGRTARFDLAVAGALAGAALESPLPLLTALPYLRAQARQARRARPGGPRPAAVALADLVADAVGLLALLEGSARYRSLVV